MSTLVLYDRLLNQCEGEQVLLFNLRRNEIVCYDKNVVRPKLRKLTSEELVLIDIALELYFPARADWSLRQGDGDSDEVREMKAELEREERAYFRAHAGDRFKTDEDWANEYLASDDPNERETGRMIMAQVRVDRESKK